MNEKICNSGGLFVLGLIIGITPCPPLTALLFEIALMSKSALEGMSYAFFFGLGTFLSGVLVVVSLAGILTKIISKVLKSKGAVRFFRIACSALLILFGLVLIFGITAK